MPLRLLSVLVVAVGLIGFATGCSETKTQDGGSSDHSKHDHSKHDDANHEQSSGTRSPSAEDPYPLTNCVVSGEKLGGHGKVYDYRHEGRLVRLCCEACVDEFKEDSAKFLAKLDAAKKAASSTK